MNTNDLKKACMYNKFVVINYGATCLRISDIEYVEADCAGNDILIHMRSGALISDPKSVYFYDENGNQFRIDTAFDDPGRVHEECARVSAQLLIRWVSLEEQHPEMAGG